MGTRSMIAIQNPYSKDVRAVYCHWDGYLEHNGSLLHKHYSNSSKVNNLIALGDISSLRPEIGAGHPFSQFDTTMTTEEFDALYGEMTTFYGRDRKESGCNAKKFKDYADYVAYHQYEEYEYILRACGDKAVWFVKCHSEDWKTLEQALIEETTGEIA